MTRTSEPSQPSGLDGPLVPYAQELTSAIATMQHVIDRLQALGIQAGLEGALDGTAAVSSGATTDLAHIMAATPALDAEPAMALGVTSAAVEATIEAGNSSTATPVSSGSAPRWYAVLIGREPGVICGANNVTPNIGRIPGGSAPRCESEADAQRVFDTALDAGLVEMVDIVLTRDRMTRNEFPIGQYRL